MKGEPLPIFGLEGKGLCTVFEIGNEKVALVTDSACDLNDALLAKYDIRFVSLRMVCSRGEFRDRVEISNDELYALLKTEVPKTSLPLPEDVSKLYASLQAQGCTHVLHLSLSSGLSGTYNLCRMLAEDYEGMKIDVVDTKTLSFGLGLLVLTAAEMLSEGKPVAEVISAVEKKRETQLGSFVIRTLEFLRKGGRIGLVEGVVGSILQLKPVIFVNDEGIYQTLTKARGLNNAIDAMCNEHFRRFADKPVRVGIVHADDPEGAEKLLAKLSTKLNVASSIIGPVSPILAVHTGPGLLGAIIQEA